MASTLAAGARAVFGSIAPAQCGPQMHEELHRGAVPRGRSRACILPSRSFGQKDRRLTNTWAGSELRAVKGAVTREGTNRRAAGIRCSADNGAPKTKKAPIRIILSGPPASGKGTQAEELVKKYKVVHIAAGDLLRAEVAAGSENGKRAKELMDGGNLVPDEIVVTLVKERLAQPDVQQHGWLLDGYPRSESQAAALEKEGIHPDAFVVLRVPDSSIVDRITGRRLDPETGRIYHMKYKKPESDEIAKRLVTRSDDTVDKVKTRLEVYSKHLNDVASLYLDEIVFVDGNRPPQEVFQDIDEVVQKLQRGEKEKAVPPREEADVRAEAEEVARESLLSEAAVPPPEETATAARPEPVRRPSESLHDSLEPIPLRLNTTPYPREIREHFYREACLAAKNAVNDGLHQLEIRCIIPELNPEMDVYRIGTLLELMRELAFTFADDGKRVKVCVQGSMGDGIFSGMPLALAGTRRIIESMDWGDEEDKANFIRFGAVGAKEVTDEDDLFIVMAPQNAVANCIIPDLEAMLEAAGTRPLIIVNPRLKDVPSSAGVMQIRGREERERFTASFFQCYNFRLLYKAATNFYPIMGALRYVYPGKYEVYRRKDMGFGEERYDLLGEFEEEPMKQDLGDVLYGRRKVGEQKLKTRGLFG